MAIMIIIIFKVIVSSFFILGVFIVKLYIKYVVKRHTLEIAEISWVGLYSALNQALTMII